jgi:hypothetical protein
MWNEVTENDLNWKGHMLDIYILICLFRSNLIFEIRKEERSNNQSNRTYNCITEAFRCPLKSLSEYFDLINVRLGLLNTLEYAFTFVGKI